MGIFIEDNDIKEVKIGGVKFTLRPLTTDDVARIQAKLKDYIEVDKSGVPRLSDEGMVLYQEYLILYSIKSWSLKEKPSLKLIKKLKPAVYQELLLNINELSGVDIKN